jgi:hypothetical protein
VDRAAVAIRRPTSALDRRRALGRRGPGPRRRADEHGDLARVLVLVHELVGVGDVLQGIVFHSTGRIFDCSMSALARLHSHALAKCEPRISFWRIHR